MFYSKSTGGFYDESLHGPRKLSVIQPGWVHPEIEVPDPDWDAEAHPDEAHPTVMILDPAVTPPLVETENPDCKIPRDAVEISEAAHQLLLAGQSEGKIIIADAEGYPVLSEPPPPTEDELAASARSERDHRLAASDWTQARDVPEALSAKWAPYRQALRDVPSQSGFPSAITWPETPK